MAIFAEYIWIDGNSPSQHVRSKTKVLNRRPAAPHKPESFPEWSFDGSSTEQAVGDTSDCALAPVAVFVDPIRSRQDHHYLVLCEVMLPDGSPHPSNHRAQLRNIVNRRDALASRGMQDESWFGLEQEYTLFKGSRPLGFPSESRFPAAQGPYYCGVGADEVYGRKLVEAHMEACVRAGILISGINAEVMPGQWEFQIGPLPPLQVGDHLWVARWLLYRLGEEYGIHATLDPKPVPGDWNGAGMHANFSTAAMRHPCTDWAGMKLIEKWCEDAGNHVQEHLAVYGDGIEMRLTGRHETCSYRDYKWGISDRTASIRIPMETASRGYGYLEDRRPNANACPYQVATVMIKTAEGLWERDFSATDPQPDPSDTSEAASASL